MKTKICQNRTSRISILACVVALISITLMSSCAKAKVEGAVQLANVLISQFGGGVIEFTTEGKNLVMVHKCGPISDETRTDADFRNSKIEFVKNDSALRYVTEDLFPLCKEAEFEYFIVRYVDSISSDTMNISIPFEEL